MTLNDRLDAIAAAAARESYLVEDKTTPHGRTLELTYHGLINGSRFFRISTHRGRLERAEEAFSGHPFDRDGYVLEDMEIYRCEKVSVRAIERHFDLA